MKKQTKELERKLKIIWSSNAAWSTSGYGSQMAYLLPELKKEGWNQAMIAFFGLEGGVINLDGIKVYPKMGDIWGADAVIHHGNDFNADITVTNQDIWVLDPNLVKMFRKWIPYVPVDHDPVPPVIVDRLKLAYRVISYSKFGQKQLASKGIHSTYIPLMVDADIYKKYDKKAMRKDLGLPEDIFLFGMVSANKDNPPRKSFQEVMDAFKMFHDKHPNSAIYFHTNPEQPGGFNIMEYAKFLGIQNFIYTPPIYQMAYTIDKEQMAKVYSCFDVLLAPSTNEGFGVPIIEAQSCEVPVITNNFTSMPEIIIEGKTGELVEQIPGPNGKRFTPLYSYVGIPSVQSIYEKMEKLFTADREAMGRAGREYVKENYDTKKVIKEYWTPFFEMVEKEIYR